MNLSDAKKIIDERFARGEISAEEHAKMIDHLGKPEASEMQHPDSTGNPPKPEPEQSFSWKQGAILAIVAIIFGAIFASNKSRMETAVYKVCRTNPHVNYNDQICRCTSKKFVSQLSWVNFLPIVGGGMPVNQSDGKVKLDWALNQCR